MQLQQITNDDNKASRSEESVFVLGERALCAQTESAIVRLVQESKEDQLLLLTKGEIAGMLQAAKADFHSASFLFLHACMLLKSGSHIQNTQQCMRCSFNVDIDTIVSPMHTVCIGPQDIKLACVCGFILCLAAFFWSELVRSLICAFWGYWLVSGWLFILGLGDACL